MGSMSDLFVRKVTDDAISSVRNVSPSGELASNAEFIRIIRLGICPPEQILMALSSRLETDVIWLSYCSIVDSFEYYHWQAGVLSRALGYGCYTEERIWERIEGQPESWEQAVFFDPESLAFLLEDEDDEAEKQQLEQFWQTGELVLGRMEPYLSAQRCAFSIATYYRFPGWDL